MKYAFFTWLPVIFWCATIYFFSAQPQIHTPFVVWWDLLLKKTAHFTEFAILFILILRALYQTLTKNNWSHSIIWAFLFTFIYAMLDEFHQRFTPGRTSTYRDVIIDLLGIIAAYFIVRQLYKYPRKQITLSSFIFGGKNG